MPASVPRVKAASPATLQLDTLTASVWTWLSSAMDRENPGQVRFCLEGDLFRPDRKAGLGTTCLALKIMNILGLFERLPGAEREAWLSRIKGFQVGRGVQAGYFEDPGLLRKLDRWWRRDWNVRRAESRQACASLLFAGSAPDHAFSFVPQTPDAVRTFVRSFDWDHPWHAGSHAGHLMAFLHVNARLFGRQEQATVCLSALKAELDRLQDPQTGCWHAGARSAGELVNGAMKVLSGYEFIGDSVRFPERIIGFALSVRNDHDACHHADLLYVLHQCARMTTHRRAEIEAVAAERLDLIAAHRRDDGGFSFYRDGSGRLYYGVQMSEGRLVSDVHATCLFVWTAAMIADILGMRERLGWRLPVT